MPWNIFIFPLIGGYIILSNCHNFKYSTIRLSKEHLMFKVVIVAIIIFIFSYWISILVQFFFPQPCSWIRNSILRLNVPHILTSFSSFIFSWFIVLSFNILGKGENHYLIDAIIKEGSNIEKELLHSVFDQEGANLLAFTLKSNKAYIGIPLIIDPPGKKTDILILIHFSGFRDNNQNLIITNSYVINSNQDTIDNEIVINKSEIISISKYDLNTASIVNPTINSLFYTTTTRLN